MPDGGGGLNVASVVQLIVLLGAVPLQLWLTRDNSESFRQYEINKFLSSMRDFGAQYLNVTGWVWWCESMIVSFSSSIEQDAIAGGDTEGQQPAAPVKQHEDGHFASSTEPRTIRPPVVQHRIGQVIKHRQHGYYGVIVGWDEQARAPAHWLDRMHPKDKPEWRVQPNYAVVIDTRDRLTPQLSYVVQENIEIVSARRVMHPLIEHYFEDYDGAQYLARPWLKAVYPQD